MRTMLACWALMLYAGGGCRHQTLVQATGQAELVAPTGPAAEQGRQAIKLAVLVVFDQLPQWALDANLANLAPTGFLRGMASQAAMLHGEYPYAATMTAVGHSTIATGEIPRIHGVSANSMYVDATGKEQGIFGQPAGAAMLRVSTAFDQWKANGQIGRIVAMSLKDRGAIALGGKTADVVIWRDGKTNTWQTSTGDGRALPAWATAVDIASTDKMTAVTSERQDVDSARALFDLADKAIATEALGQGAKPDVLAISVSSLDFAGHADGAESARYQAVLRAADERLAAFVQGLTTKHGLTSDEVMLVLTSDHGSAPLPELMTAPDPAMAWSHGSLPPRHDEHVHEAPRGRFDDDAVAAMLDARIDATRGQGQWVATAIAPYMYLGRDAEALDLAARRKLMEALLALLRAMPGVWRAYEVNAAGVVIPGSTSPVGAPDFIDELVKQSVPTGLTSDIYIVLSPFWVFSSGTTRGTHHGTPWDYDRQVPIVVWPAARAPMDTGTPLSMTQVAKIIGTAF